MATAITKCLTEVLRTLIDPENSFNHFAKSQSLRHVLLTCNTATILSKYFQTGLSCRLLVYNDTIYFFLLKEYSKLCNISETGKYSDLFFFQNSYLGDPAINVFLKCQICFHGNMKCHSWRWCSIQMWRVEGYLTCFQLYLFNNGCYTLKLNKEIKIYLSKVDLWQSDFYTCHYCLQQHSLMRRPFEYLSAGGAREHFLLYWMPLPSPISWGKGEVSATIPTKIQSAWMEYRGRKKRKKKKMTEATEERIASVSP